MSKLTLLDVSATQASNCALVVQALARSTPRLAWLSIAPLAAALDDDDLAEPSMIATGAGAVMDADVRALIAGCRQLTALDLRYIFFENNIIYYIIN